MKTAIIALVLLCTGSVHGQTLKTSSAYPLQARIIAVEEQKVGGGSTYAWQLMKAVIGDRLYGLSYNITTVYGVRVTKRATLEMGSYPVKRVKGGFDFQYVDDGGKVRHEVLHIESEEPAPVEEPIQATTPQTPEPTTNVRSDKLDRYAIASGNDLLALCSTDSDFALCIGYIRGVQDTLGEFSVSGVKTPFPVCFGANPPTNGQSVEIVVKFMRDNPAIRNEDAGAVAMGALSQAFRCSKSDKKPK